MAHYLITAKCKPELLDELEAYLNKQEFRKLRPFGNALSYSLVNARVIKEGLACWEEEDYCTPPLLEERTYVLDKYFDLLDIKRVSRGEGWKEIAHLPLLFPRLKNDIPGNE